MCMLPFTSREAPITFVGCLCATKGPRLLSDAGVLQHQDTQGTAHWRIHTEADTLDPLPASRSKGHCVRPSDGADDLEVSRDLRTSAPLCFSPSGVI